MTLTSALEGSPPSPDQSDEVDKELYKHHEKVVDARRRVPVNDKTTLACLYLLDNNDSFNQTQRNILLRNLVGIAEPKIEVKLTTEDGKVFPALGNPDAASYVLRLTYNKLMFAPRVRLECAFTHFRNRTTGLGSVMALEFHFRTGGETDLQEYKHEGNTISFVARGATVSGLSYALENYDNIPEQDRGIVEHFRLLNSSKECLRLSFQLDEDNLSSFGSESLTRIIERLPGGSGLLLPAFKHNEYAMFEGSTRGIIASSEYMPAPRQLMDGKVPHPMIPLKAYNTFSSVKEAAVEHWAALHFADVESRTSLELWARTDHDCKLFNVAGFPIIAVNFRRFRKLGGINEDVKYRLPREIFVKMKLPNEHFEGYLESEAMDLPPHQAFFVVTSKSLKEFERHLGWKPGDDKYRRVEFEPHYNSFTFNSQLETINLLQTATQWHPHLLNQRCDLLEEYDMTAGVDIGPARIKEADDRLQKLRKWNEEQKRVIQQIHKARGRMAITMGIAGTGKTLLQSAIAMYFAKLGFKCLICTPANSNADHSAKLLCEFAREDSNDGPIPGQDAHQSDKIRVHRLYPSSRNVGLKNLSEDQAKHHKVGHTDRAVSSIHGLEFKLRNHKDRKAGVRDLAIEQGVIDEAEKGVLKLHRRLTSEAAPVEVWARFREHLKASREGTFNWKDEVAKREYNKCYEYCKTHLVVLTEIMVTTTGNSRCQELVDWVYHAHEYGVTYKGIIVLCDEAPKDLEMNTWMPIIMPGARVRGVFLFGDDKQLAPTNTCSKGKLNFNIYNDRLNIPLPLRLINESFPYVALKEQQRMHPCISEFPNEEFYDSELRDGPKVNIKLERVQPGLEKVLHGIIAKSFENPMHAENYVKHATDEQARHHYLEIPGNVQRNEESGSVMVKAHLDVFFKHVFPDLQKFWGDKTKEKLMIICGYGYALGEYKLRFLKLQNQQQLPSSHYPTVVEQQQLDGATTPATNTLTQPNEAIDSWSTPNPEPAQQPPDKALYDPRVLTIDSAQGQESFMVVMDGSFQYRDRMGFMTDRGRCNVAMTRAKAVFWILGGELRCKSSWNSDKPLSPFPKLKKRMEAQGRVHRFSA